MRKKAQFNSLPTARGTIARAACARASEARLEVGPLELAFEDHVQYHRALSPSGKACVNHKVARFRQVDLDNPHVHHDALEFPGGAIVMLTHLFAGQKATVLQLPARPLKESETRESLLTFVEINTDVRRLPGP